MEIQNLFTTLRQMAGSLSQPQVDSVNAILEACSQHGVTDTHQIAYVLATAYHEARLKPVEEIGKGQGHPYGGMLKMAKDSNGNHIPYTTPNQIYYGRGLVQTTWYENYAQFGKLLNIDLLNHPELALNTPVAAEIIVVGMKGGLFTGASLGRFFTPTSQDPINARKIINGLDCAQLIAGYYSHILAGLI